MKKKTDSLIYNPPFTQMLKLEAALEHVQVCDSRGMPVYGRGIIKQSRAGKEIWKNRGPIRNGSFYLLGSRAENFSVYIF